MGHAVLRVSGVVSIFDCFVMMSATVALFRVPFCRFPSARMQGHLFLND